VQGNDLFDTTIYLNSPDNKYRYALGTRGERTIYCFGINPSTATPEKYDSTVTRVKNIAYRSGFDSFVMLNVYPFRATDPDDLPKEINSGVHNRNIEVILDVIKNGNTIWAAFGDLIFSRPYLKDCWYEIAYYIQKYRKNIEWVKMGELTANKNPRHPLYLKHQPFTPFAINEWIEKYQLKQKENKSNDS